MLEKVLKNVFFGFLKKRLGIDEVYKTNIFSFSLPKMVIYRSVSESEKVRSLPRIKDWSLLRLQEV